MELSESVQRGLRSLAEPSSFDRSSFQALLDAAVRSLLPPPAPPAPPALLERPELQHVERILLKQSHAAAATFLLEAVKQGADKSTVSSCLEELSFSSDRIEVFCNTHQEHREPLEQFLASIGRRPPRISDASWRLKYHVKNGQVDKVSEPFYSVSLSVQDDGASEDVDFTCTVEQLQDLVGKLKDAAKSVEKAAQV